MYGAFDMRRLSALTLLAVSLSLSTSSQAGATKRIDEAASTPQNAKRPQKDLWIVSQKTDGETNYTVCTSPGAIKFVVGNLALIAKQPDWQINILNERTKKYWEMPLTDFNGFELMERFDVKKLQASADELTKDQRSIFKRDVLKFDGKPEPSTEKLKKMGFTPTKISIWSCSDIKVEPPALDVLSRIYGLNGLQGIPLRIEMETAKGEKITCVSPEFCFQRNSTDKFFEVPKHFSKAASRDDVLARASVKTTRSQLQKNDASSAVAKKMLKQGESKNSINTGSPVSNINGDKSKTN